MTLRRASAEEGRAVLAAEDDFTRALGSFDRSFRMRTIEPVADPELRRFLGEQAIDFTPEEAAAWDEAIAAVAPVARELGGMPPTEVVVVKTTGREERNHAYTRAHAIALPAARVERLRGERAIYLLAHELFHVASRASRALRNDAYALLEFAPLGPIVPPAALDSRRLTNPDAFALSHYLRLGERAVMPLLMCSMPLAEAIGRNSVLDSVNVALMEIDPRSGAVMVDAHDVPLLIAASETDWARRLARNTTYTIHPEEVLADNYALLVRRRLGSDAPVTDPSFLRDFEAALRASRA